MTKQQLRKQYLAQRQQLSAPDYVALNGQLLRQFEQLDFSLVKCLHIFLPMRKRMEPDTYLLINWLKAAHPEIQIVYPQTDFACLSMQSFADDELLQIAENTYGIPEPVAGNLVNEAAIDMVIVPLLVFDLQGYRVGYGKGFYDRFLTRCRPDTQVIGLSFFDPVNAITDLDAHDVRMHCCLTPTRQYRFPAV